MPRGHGHGLRVDTRRRGGLPPGLQFRFDASQIAGLSGGAAVAQWDDFSGNGRHATQGNADNRPTFQLAQINGLPEVRFDGSDALLLGDLSAAFASAATLAIVARINSAGYCLYATHVLEDVDFSFWRYDGDGNGYLGAFRTVRQNGYPAAMPSSGVHLFVLTSSAGAYSLRLDGVAKAGGTASFTAGNAHRIGSDAQHSVFFTGGIGEICAWNSALAAADIAAVESYLAPKWGVSI